MVDLGAKGKMLETFGEELGKVKGVFAASDPFRLLMESPSFPLEKKRAMLTDLASLLALSNGMGSFLGLLLEKDRIAYLPQIEADYRQLADKLSGIMRAEVTAAVELNDVQRQAILAALEKQTGKKVEVKAEVDPSLIGGLRVEIGGRVFDGSLKTQLKRIEDTLKKG